MKYSKDFISPVTAPDYFRSHAAVVASEHFHKAFDEVGLDNFTATGNIPGYEFALKELKELDRHYRSASGYLTIISDQLALLNIRLGVEHLIANTSSNKPTISKSLKDDLGKIIFKSGTSIEGVIKSLMVRSKNLSRILKYPHEKLSLVKKHLDGNGKTYNVVFSANPADILTMSMRGIVSCMNWDSTHAKHLVGSVLDPYAAVIYVTDGTPTAYGTKMIYRSVVRMVKERKDPGGKFHFFVEGAYPKLYNPVTGSSNIDRAATEMFREVLKARIKGSRKIGKVIDFDCPTECFIPLSDAVRDLNYYDRSCVDSGIIYREMK